MPVVYNSAIQVGKTASIINLIGLSSTSWYDDDDRDYHQMLYLTRLPSNLTPKQKLVAARMFRGDKVVQPQDEEKDNVYRSERLWKAWSEQFPSIFDIIRETRERFLRFYGYQS